MKRKPKTKGALYDHLSKIGSEGGKKSRRELSRTDAQEMARRSVESRRKLKEGNQQ